MSPLLLLIIHHMKSRHFLTPVAIDKLWIESSQSTNNCDRNRKASSNSIVNDFHPIHISPRLSSPLLSLLLPPCIYSMGYIHAKLLFRSRPYSTNRTDFHHFLQPHKKSPQPHVDNVCEPSVFCFLFSTHWHSSDEFSAFIESLRSPDNSVRDAVWLL